MESDEPPDLELKYKENPSSTNLLEKGISNGRKSMMINQLIGLGETQRRIYEQLDGGLNLENTSLGEAYEHHKKELELLIKYQNENN